MMISSNLLVAVSRVLFLFFLIMSASCSPTSAKNKFEKIECPQVNSLDKTLNNKSKSILIFGKIHGTKQTPEFIEGVVCRSTQLGYSLDLALPIHFDNQFHIDKFLKSAGNTKDIVSLINTDFWKTNRSGHSSQAVLNLLERVRELKSTGATINVIAYKSWKQAEAQKPKYIGQEYADLVVKLDAKLLNNVIANSTATKTIILSGDADASKNEIDFVGQPYKPLASHLPKDKLLSFYMVFRDGESWACILNEDDVKATGVHIRTTCGPHEWRSNISDWAEDAKIYTLFDFSSSDLPEDRWNTDGGFYVGVITSSPPAYDIYGGDE